MECDSFMAAMPLAAMQGCRSELPGDDAALMSIVSILNAHEPNGSQLIMPLLCLLREIIRSGRSLPECLTGVTAAYDCSQFRNAVSKAWVNLQQPFSQFSDEVGSACANPSSLTCALHAALSFPVYTDSIRAIALAGGCSCSRSVTLLNFQSVC
jgi:hypothetical protein